jgi:hypothetical protein
MKERDLPARRGSLRPGGLVAVLLALVTAIQASPAAAEGTGDFQLRWIGRVYSWRYNAEHRPAWLSDEEALSLIRAAADGWSPCGVTLRYEGLTDKVPGVMDGENVIGWKADGRAYSAWTSWRMHRDGRAIEADVTLYANIFDDYRRRGIDTRLELRKTVVHELGHVLGLGHSARPGDAMIVKVRTRPEWKLPSANDLARCRALYPER